MKLFNYPQKESLAEDQSPIRILLVDDDEDEFIITRRIISEIDGRKHLLDWSSTYEEGFEKILEANHDIFLIDYRLGERTGLDLLKAATAEGCSLPMILLTGQEDRAVDIEGMKAGAWDYLVKGRIDAPMLERAIRYTLEHKKVLDVMLESQRQREKFVATLTHDLKTPIKAEFRVFELLLAERFGPITADQEMVVNEMLRSNRFMYQMVDNLLTAFKFEEGYLILRFENHDLNEMITAMVNLDLLGLAQDRQQALVLDLQENLPPIPYDALEIKRVVYNLIQNAINYSNKNDAITVSTRLTADRVEITIADNGPGIEKELQKTLFEPYASMAKRYRHIGTGLGLYICKKLVEAHRGTITLESELGAATRFTFSLPRVQEEATLQVQL